jgi:hypothetical protein
MRPLLTWLVVGALVAIGLFAARDALRGGSDSPRPPVAEEKAAPPNGPPPAIPGRPGLVAELTALGAHGALYLTDVTCRRFVLSLPTLRWTTPQGLPGADCGLWARAPVSAASGIAARQVNADTIEVTSGGWSYGFEGTSPAFKPDGTLTFVRDGRLFEWTARCPQTVEIIRFEGLHDVPRCVRLVAGAPRSIREVAWLGDRDYAAIAGPDGASSVLVVRGGRERRLFTGVGTRVGALQASPLGRFLAARLDGTLVLLRTDSAGAHVPPASGELVRSITWSPDDRVAALATERSIDIFRSGARGGVVAVPISVALVDWR